MAVGHSPLCGVRLWAWHGVTEEVDEENVKRRAEGRGRERTSQQVRMRHEDGVEMRRPYLRQGTT